MVEEKTEETEKDSVSDEAGRAENTSAAFSGGPDLARWFWCSFFLMAALSVMLGVAATLRINSGGLAAWQDTARLDVSREQSALELDEALSNANEAALEAVLAQIDPLLEAAYKPVYDSVPLYTNYHFSVWGEYAELGAAVIGAVGVKLQTTLFDGLDNRLYEVGVSLDEGFNSAFQDELRTFSSYSDSHESGYGSLTMLALEDAKSRMMVTAPVSATVAIGTAATIKSVSAAVAKKIAAKLSVKAAAKAGGKWAAAATGAGTGAAVCSWAGPGAGLCAAAGGVGAWLVADYGIVKLDEYWNRSEFEADLRAMLEEQKAVHRAKFIKAIRERVEAIHEVSDEIVQNHDFTLRELSGAGSGEICKVAAELTAGYELLRMNLRARTQTELENLRAEASGHLGNLSLRQLAQEIEENLKVATVVAVSQVQIKGNLPESFRSDRDISGRLILDGVPFSFERAKSTEIGGFNVTVRPGRLISSVLPLRISVAVEQHLRLWRNPYFSGEIEIDVFDAVGTSDGLEHRISLQIPIALSQDARNIDEAAPSNHAARTKINLLVKLGGSQLPALQKAPKCK